MSLFTENSLIYKAMDNQEARNLMERIIDKKALVNIDLSEIMRFEIKSCKERKNISCMYSSCGSDEILKEWAKNHAEAQDILLFTEGTLIDGSNMAHTLDDAMDHNVTIAFGVIEGKAEGGKVVGVFM